MDSPYEKDQHSDRPSSFNQTDEASPPGAPEPISSSEASTTSHDDNHDIVEFGPLKIKQRKKPAPTLATGRRSKYEMLTPDEEYKRNVRRERNRAAAERVRLSRLNIEQQLQDQIDELQNKEEQLLNNVQTLRYRKLQLETRIHGPSTAYTSNTASSSYFSDLPSAFNNHHMNFSSFDQPTPSLQNHFDDLFLNSPLPPENNDLNSLSTMIPDDVDDFIMNP